MYGQRVFQYTDFYGSRYLYEDTFFTYYLNLKSANCPQKLMRDLQKEDLIYLRQLGLVIPDYTIRYPVEYRRIEDDLRGDEEKFAEILKEKPIEWRKLFALEKKQSAWDANNIMMTPFIEPHPFDEEKEEPMLYGHNIGTIADHNYEVYHFYNYWKVYYIDALFNENSMSVIGRQEDLFKCFEDKRLPLNSKLASKVPARLRSEDILKQQAVFNLIIDYLYVKKRELNFRKSLKKKRDTLGINFNDQEWREIERVLTEKSKEFCLKRSIEEQDLLSFIEMIAELALFYQESEKKRFERILIKDISSCLELLEYAFEFNRKDSFKRVRILKNLYPDVREEVEKDTVRMLTQSLRVYPNADIPTASDLEDVVNYCRDSNLYLLFDTVQQINEDWNWLSYKSYDKLMGYLRNISIVVEDFLKAIGSNCHDNEIKNYFLSTANNLTIGSSLKTFFATGPYSAIWFKYEGIETSKRKASRENTYEVLEETINSNSLSQDCIENRIVKMFLITNIIRNYSCHNCCYDEKIVMHHFFDILYHLLSTVVFVWTYNKNLNKSQNSFP